MSASSLLWHSRHCGRDTTDVLYEDRLTPSKKRPARLIRQALCINLGSIFAALSVRSWEIYRPSSSVRSWPPADGLPVLPVLTPCCRSRVSASGKFKLGLLLRRRFTHVF